MSETPLPEVDVATRPAQVEAAAPAQTQVVVAPGVEVAATYEALMLKARRTGEFKVPDPGNDRVLVVKAQAIDYYAYDKLLEVCPPTEKQRLEHNAAYDLAKFGPRLLAACLTDPALSTDQAEALWRSPNWAGGEIVDLWRKVNNLCQVGLDIPFTALG